MGFGESLRRYRIAAGLTQEELAERAGLSTRGIQDLERGARQSPRQATVRRLAAALGEPGLESNIEGLEPTNEALAAARPRLALSSFVGRERELDELRSLLSRSRLVTLTGSGGIGKTRLAFEVAAAMAASGFAAVGVAELAAIDDGSLVVTAVASALGIREQPFRPLIETLRDALQSRSVLLVLDNCEHQIPACVTLADALLGSCSMLRILATSREPLRMHGETVWRVPPLTMPDPRADLAADALDAYGATRLFVERARAASPNLTLSDRDIHAIVVICQRVNGVPLAIELAAARTSMFSTEQIASRLDDAIRLLTNGSRNAPIRHQTLRAAIDWSYALLSETERVLFQRLSIFAGGWTIEAAEDVCAEVPGPDDMLNVLGHLVDKSLIVVEPTADGTMRYRLQEVLRQYARHRLLERGAQALLQERHAGYFLHLVEHAEPRALTVDRKAWLDRLELELDNFRAARAWFIARGDAEGAQSLAACLYRLLFYRGHAREGRQSLIEALALSGGSDSTRGKALQFLGGLAFTQADYPAVERYCGEALALRRKIANPSDIAASLTTLGVAASMRADFTAARAYLDEARRVGPTSDDTYVVPLSISVSALAAYLEGDYAMARVHTDAALDLARAAGFTAIECQALSTLGNLRYLQGDHDGAREALDAALARADTVGEPYLLARPALTRAMLATDDADLPRARTLLADRVRSARELGNDHHLAMTLESIAAFAVTQHQPLPALQFAGAAAAIRDALCAPLGPTEQQLLEARLSAAHATRNEPAVEAALAQGRTWTTERAAAHALAFLLAA
jgi:predicted ATPase/DNA-binding XRE family transcriptional regulator